MEKFFCTKDSPVVEVKQGKIKGYFFDGVYRFLGVPYAKAQRFMMPEEPDHFLGALPHGRQFNGVGGLFLHASYLITVQKVSSRRIASVQRPYDTADFIIIS